MKYSGRIIGLTFSTIGCFGGSVYIHLFFEERTALILALLTISVVGWRMGSKYDEVKFFSEKDMLTNVYNRRFVYNFFPKILSKVNKNKDKLSIFVIDIDNFKKINDSFGHEKGDSVIHSLSKILFQNSRNTDVVSRWGGDEFLLIIPIADEMFSGIFLERVNAELEEVSKKLGFTVSISVGKSIYPDNATEFDDLIKIADKQMYQQKKQKKEQEELPIEAV